VFVRLRLVSRMVVVVRAMLTRVGVHMNLFPAVMSVWMLMLVDVFVLVNVFVFVRMRHILMPVLMRMSVFMGVGMKMTMFMFSLHLVPP